MNANEDRELLPSLFRTEYSKIVAVLCRSFGLTNIEVAQDIASDTFLKATETWGINKIPKEPKAWLYAVAKNRAKDQFKRLDTYYDKVVPIINKQSDNKQELELDFTEDNINDSVLQMMFTVCNPILYTDAQVSLALRVLCSFSIDEIASALLTSKSNINKRLVRAKKKFKDQNIKINLPEKHLIKERLDSVLLILYLLFNEGYYATTTDAKVRTDLCYEAMRLNKVLLDQASTNTNETKALAALFCFHASRLEARIDDEGNQVLYKDQKTDKWDFELIKQGQYFLNQVITDNFESKYAIEAMIAFWHTRIDEHKEKKWEYILVLYNKLLQYDNSPLVYLNRALAISKVEGKEKAIVEVQKIELEDHPLYHSLLADLYTDLDEAKKTDHLHKAISLSKNEKDKEILRRKLKQ